MIVNLGTREAKKKRKKKHWETSSERLELSHPKAADFESAGMTTNR